MCIYSFPKIKKKKKRGVFNTHNIVNWLQKALELTLQNHYPTTHLRNVVFHIDFTSSKQHSDTHTHTSQTGALSCLVLGSFDSYLIRCLPMPGIQTSNPPDFNLKPFNHEATGYPHRTDSDTVSCLGWTYVRMVIQLITELDSCFIQHRTA